MTVWARRALTIPSLALLTLLWLLLLPATLPVAALVDLVRGGRRPLVRCVVYLALYLACETGGVAAAFLLWIASGVWAGGSRARFVRWNVALQAYWATILYRAAERVFSFTTEVEGSADAASGPIIVLIRHTSTADTLLPVVYLTGRHGMALRYVLKRELLWDPCLDVVGQRLPNAFIVRGSGEGGREIAAVQRLSVDLGPKDGVLIYPEGTRFTAAKRERILAKLARHPDRRFERGAALRHVLPPHTGGVLGLLAGNADADVVLCAHTGLEPAGSLRGVMSGRLIGTTVRVRFWRLARATVPTDAAARVAWLYDQWSVIDTWIDRQHPVNG